MHFWLTPLHDHYETRSYPLLMVELSKEKLIETLESRETPETLEPEN